MSWSHGGVRKVVTKITRRAFSAFVDIDTAQAAAGFRRTPARRSGAWMVDGRTGFAAVADARRRRFRGWRG